MKQREKNWTLLPFLIGSCVFAVLMTLSGGYRGWAIPIHLILFFILGFLGMVLVLAIMIVVPSLFVNQNEPQTSYEPYYHALVKYVMGLVPAVFRVRIHATGTQIIPTGRWLLVGNHRSGFDPLVTGWVLRRYSLAFITKPSVQKIPVVGNFIHKAFFMGIDRENDRAAMRTVLQSIRLLKENKTSIGVYPEGTRNQGEGLLPFRNGAFKIAQKAKTPIVIVALQNTDRIMSNFPWRHTDVYVDICGVIEQDRVEKLSTAEIGEEVQQSILSMITPLESLPDIPEF